MEITIDDLRKFATKPNRPIPGESLTRGTEEPYAWEKPPRFTNKDEAMEYFIGEVLEDKTFFAIMNTLAEGTPVMDIVQVFLVKGFQDGLINPDLMLLLAEPFAYLLLGLSEREGIRAKIVDDPDDPYDPDDPDNLASEEQYDNLFKNKLQTITEPKDDEDLNLSERIPSLMSRGETK
tara:strand:- start:710 stop:1243 length:534 start_codon:yes stop_codon:yes gene_type:complete